MEDNKYSVRIEPDRKNFDHNKEGEVNWRHDDWSNPFPESLEVGDENSPEDIWTPKFCMNTLNGWGHDAFEAGADAMLEVIYGEYPWMRQYHDYILMLRAKAIAAGEGHGDQ